MINLKNIKLILFTILLLLPIMVSAKVNVYLFHSRICTHCQDEIEYLNEIKDEYNLDLKLYQIYEDSVNTNLMNEVKEKIGIDSPYVPFTVIGTNYVIGFSEGTTDSIIELIKKYDGTDIVDKIINKEDISKITSETENLKTINTIFGKIDLAKLSLPVIAIVIGSVDGFNPCAMWILVFLISMLFNMKNKRKMWILGITFLTTSALVYLLFMVAWLNIATSALTITWIRLLISLVAIIGSFINIRSYIKSLKNVNGCEIVSDKKRKVIFNSIKRILSEKYFVLALLGIMLLAFCVNLIELACSAGLPLVFTQILAMNDLNNIQYATYIIMYIFFFLLDDIVVFVIAMLTLNISGISTKYTKYSHLIGGIIMLIIGLLMFFKPDWLSFGI